MSLLRALSAVSMLACGPSVVTTPTEVPVAAFVASESLSTSATNTCIGRATEDLIPPFIAPSGSPEFRRAFGRKVAELRCCLTDDRRDELRGERLSLSFEPLSRNPADGSRAVLREYQYENDPDLVQESRCVHAIVNTWRMAHAPVSDVVRTPLDPTRGPRSDAASVLLSYPWPH